jgi:hypothetical protein
VKPTKEETKSIIEKLALLYYGRCVLDVQKLEREVPYESSAHIAYLKGLIIRNIERFSRSRSKSKIQKYVDQNFKVDGGFGLGLQSPPSTESGKESRHLVNRWVNAIFNFKKINAL